MDSNHDSDSDSDSNADQSNSNWQDITLDLLLKIHSFLDSRIDLLRFRSICKSWRSSTPKPSHSPNPNLAYYRIPSQHRLIGNPPSILVQSEIYHLFDPSRRSFVSSVVAVEEQLICFRFWKGLEWKKIIHSGPWFPYSDVIYRKGRFYAVDETRRLVIVNKSMKVEVVNSPDVLSAGLISNSYTTYLVNFNRELHLVVLYYGEKEDIRDPFNTKNLIYRYVEENKDWVRVSRCSSFSVLTSEASLCKKNCIYFQMDIHTESSSYEKGSVSFTAVFDIAKGYCDDFATNFNSPGSVITFNFA